MAALSQCSWCGCWCRMNEKHFCLPKLEKSMTIERCRRPAFANPLAECEWPAIHGRKCSEHRQPADVTNPTHYKTAAGLEAITVIEAFGWGFCLANAFKYIARAGKKADVAETTDLKKALWYINRRIEQLEKK